MGDLEMAEFVGLWSVPPPQAQPPPYDPQQKVPNRRFTAMEWEEQKPIIQRLYTEEDSTLPQVQQILTQAGFHATYVFVDLASFSMKM